MTSISQDPIIETQNLTKSFGSGNTLVHAIRGISIRIESGEFLSILGKSGSGKSTFVSLVAGLEKPTQGIVTLEGESLVDKTQDELSLLRRKMIGIVFQHFHLIDTMTALENVELPLLIANVLPKTRKIRAIEALKLVGLEEKLYHVPEDLSGGEKQRVCIARALINKPRIILADEPTGDLDSETGDAIIQLLMQINQDPKWNPVIIMVTHDLTKLRDGMRVIKLKDGQVTQDERFSGNSDHLQ